jgi:IS5 family transposase
VALDEPTLDHNTLWRFREELAGRGLAERLLACGQCPVRHAGDGPQAGDADRCGPRAKANVVAANRRKGGRPVDPDVRWTKRDRRLLQGYKTHVAVDRGSGLVCDLDVTAAGMHDRRKGSDLVPSDEAAVHTDEAYDAMGLRNFIRSAGPADRVMRAGLRHRRLKASQRWMTRPWPPIRSAVERVFGTLKGSNAATVPGSATPPAMPST